MFQIDAMSRTPIYEQLIEQLERFILSGLIQPGEQLPSVRGLSIELHINPNTIQKAYSELDGRGIIRSVPGKGCFVCADALHLLQVKTGSRIAELSEIAAALAAADIPEDEAIACIHQAYQTHAQNRKENPQ